MLKRNVFTLLGTRSSSCKIGSKWKNSDLHHISNQRPTLFQFSTPLFSNVSYFPRGREHSVFIPSIISNTKSFRTSITTSHTAQSRFSSTNFFSLLITPSVSAQYVHQYGTNTESRQPQVHASTSCASPW